MEKWKSGLKPDFSWLSSGDSFVDHLEKTGITVLSCKTLSTIWKKIRFHTSLFSHIFYEKARINRRFPSFFSVFSGQFQIFPIFPNRVIPRLWIKKWRKHKHSMAGRKKLYRVYPQKNGSYPQGAGQEKRPAVFFAYSPNKNARAAAASRPSGREPVVTSAFSWVLATAKSKFIRSMVVRLVSRLDIILSMTEKARSMEF